MDEDCDSKLIEEEEKLINLRIGAANTVAIRALLAMVRLRYDDAANLYDEAARRVPETYQDIAENYRKSAVDARWRANDLRGSVEAYRKR